MSPELASPSIRRATPDDAQALSRVAIETFRETFGHLYPPEDLQAFLDDSHTPQAYQQLAADPAYALWLLLASETAVGYAVAGPCRLPHPDVQPGDGELKRLYIRTAQQNGGWGGRLFGQTLDWLERDGPRRLWISVWSENVAAQRFYARHGFRKDGEYDFPVGRVRDREYIFRRDPGLAS